jgi:23S rRNA (adenine1618-N6)-methyltransferase
LKKQNQKSTIPKGLHPRNIHNGNYDFDALVKVNPTLQQYVFLNQYGTQTIDFSNPNAIIALNKSLLMMHYFIQQWDIPAGYLCPPIPGRADYVHYIADLLAEELEGTIPQGDKIKCLDIGVGANCIYPIIGHQSYGWQFVGSDIDAIAIDNASRIINSNPSLKDHITLHVQTNKDNIFKGIINKEEYFHATFCNPPFYTSALEAFQKNTKKNNGLKNTTDAKRNFGGNANELWCKGGELSFIKSMIRESVQFAENCMWFTTLVSNKDNLYYIRKHFEKYNIKNIKIVSMAQGQKISRFVAWRF